jgi:DNA-directed RNA polymerase subunit M/transcription elongation factor TFIIS
MSKAFENLFCDNCHNLLFPTRVKTVESQNDMVILECKICFAEKQITPGQRIFYSKSFTTNSRKNQFDNSVIQYDYTLKRINLVESGQDRGKSKEYVYVLDSNLKQTIYETDFETRITDTDTQAGSSATEPMELQ